MKFLLDCISWNTTIIQRAIEQMQQQFNAQIAFKLLHAAADCVIASKSSGDW
jgi:hypothetical protein